MKIKIIVIGKVKEKSIHELINEYLKRLKPYTKIEIIELKDKGLEKEAENILPYLGNNSFILDERGKEYTSIGFSELINKNQDIIFIIGSAEGISESLKKKANLISLSKMTFTHEMARLFLIEQIYRSMMILNNREYHK